MKEKELRLALVCYGGVSLAVYMHGVTKEILKLVRASKVLHGVRDRAARAETSYEGLTRGEAREQDTEGVYFDLLKDIGREIDLRVVVDVIAGASAGGINGVMLARALAHDLPQDALRQLWLERTDVTDLLAEDRRARAWSKVLLRPLLWFLLKKPLARFVPDMEMRDKLSLFIRSRWFRPPFDGRRMMDSMYRGLEAMGQASNAASLLPPGHRLDLQVTVTDFYGYLERLPLHDPPEVHEREHRHVLGFAYHRSTEGQVESDFDETGLPALAFAARATSSFPGAFPPVTLGEIDRYLHERGIDWPRRLNFVERCFRRHREAGTDPNRAAFVDGSVLVNKPFGQAIRAIAGRPAFREVDRRVVYIDPHPRRPNLGPPSGTPSFFRTLRGALSDIPRNEPIREEIQAVDTFNRHVRRLRTILDTVRPQIGALVTEVIGEDMDRQPTFTDIARWRDAANTRSAKEAGFAYQGYARLKIATAVDSLVKLMVDAAGIGRTPSAITWLEREVEAWLKATGVLTEPMPPPDQKPAWVKFLLVYDVGFRIRRLRFVVRSLNHLYATLASSPGTTTEMLDELKRALYGVLDHLTTFSTPAFLSQATVERIRLLFIEANARGFEGPGDLAGTLEAIGGEIDLKTANSQTDEIFGVMVLNYLGPAARHELFVAYIGFAFWDVMAFSVSQWQDLGEFDEIRIDRISPDDAPSLQEAGVATTLKGAALGHFAGFFNRRYRENDYLWGRLHAAERLIDIVVDAAGRPDVDVAGMKQRAFAAILKAEAPHLAKIGDLIGTLSAKLASPPAG